jgi:anti-anti-sigma factor
VGELDLASVPAFEAAIATIDIAGFSRVVLDLRDLEFLDSTGLRAILSLRSSMPDASRLRIVRGPDAVHRVFTVTGLDTVLSVESSPDA